MFDRVEQATSDFSDVGKGSGTPEAPQFSVCNQYFSSLLDIGKSLKNRATKVSNSRDISNKIHAEK